jgi:26S proteasome regulatory subunit N11
MLLNLYKQKWNLGLKLKNQTSITEHSHSSFESLSKLAIEWSKRIDEETKESNKELVIKNTGKLDPKRHIRETVEEVVNDNILGILGGMISTKAF